MVLERKVHLQRHDVYKAVEDYLVKHQFHIDFDAGDIASMEFTGENEIIVQLRDKDVPNGQG